MANTSIDIIVDSANIRKDHRRMFLMLDKKRDLDLIRTIDATIRKTMDDAGWDSALRSKALTSLVDADVEVTGDSTCVAFADRHPEYAGKCRLMMAFGSDLEIPMPLAMEGRKLTLTVSFQSANMTIMMSGVDARLEAIRIDD